MKSLALLLFLIPISTFGQDKIFTTDNDTIDCKITLVNNLNIFYTYKKKKSERSDHIALSDVSSYSQGDKTTKPAIDTVAAKTPDKPIAPVTQSSKMKGIGAMILGATLQGIGAVLNAIAVSVSSKSTTDANAMAYVASGCTALGSATIVIGLQKNSD